MLDREFLSTSGLSSGEFIQWVGAERQQLTPFEARLFKEAEAAEIITGGDNAAYAAEELRELIDTGVIAWGHGFDSKSDFERSGRIEDAALELIDSYNGNAADTLDRVLDVLQKAAKNARSDDRKEELNDLIDRLEDVIKYVDKLDKAVNS